MVRPLSTFEEHSDFPLSRFWFDSPSGLLPLSDGFCNDSASDLLLSFSKFWAAADELSIAVTPFSLFLGDG